MKKNNKASLIINFTVTQFMDLGLHLGHTSQNSIFLAAWMFFCWSDNLFMLNMMKTIMNMKAAILSMKKTTSYSSPIWFISLNDVYAPLISSYAVICGEPFNSYSWMNGTLNNYSRMFGWHKLLMRLMEAEKYLFSYMDKSKIAAFYGFLSYSSSIPGLGFFPTYFDNIHAIEEFVLSSMISMGIVDSDVPSGDVFIPLPSNDDSWACINFFTFLVSKTIYASKIFNMSSWSSKVMFMSKMNKKFIKSKIIVLNFLKRSKELKLELKPIKESFGKFSSTVYGYYSPSENNQNKMKQIFYVNDSLFSVTHTFRYFDNFNFVEDMDL